MRIRNVALLALILWSASVLADGGQYQIRVDGMACPYCAYGIEKNLKKIDGVEEIVVDLNKGLVTVNVTDGTTFSDSQLTKLFSDAGFTFRSMRLMPLDEPAVE